MTSSQPFFILGNPRSGTSLLRSLLNAHPHMIIPPECGFLLWLHPTWQHASWDKASKQSFAEAVGECRKFETWGLTVTSLFQELEHSDIRTYADAATSVYTAYARTQAKSATLWGDKNNYYIREVTAIRAIYPAARFIHIVRDVRDIICSFRELDRIEIDSIYRPRKSLPLAQIVSEWIANNRAADSSLEGTPYTFIRYEDVVRRTSATLNSIFDSLEVPRLTDISPTSHLKNLDEPVEFLQWKAKLNGPIVDSSIGRYKNELTSSELQQVDAMAGALLAKYGYIR